MPPVDEPLVPDRARRPVQVPAAVAGFLLAGLVALLAVAALLALALRGTARDEAVRDARVLTVVEARDVVGPLLRDDALAPTGPARDALDRAVRDHVLGDRVVRVKVWDADGRIVYSDDTSLVGQVFGLPDDEREALAHPGQAVAEVSDLDEAENAGEAGYDRLLQVYLGVRTVEGTPLLFETYQPYATIVASSNRQWRASLPALLGGLVLLYLVQAPLAARMARRLRAAQEEREQLLLRALAAQDRERRQIAADLHDGVVQGLAGASWQLSAAAREGDGPAAEAAGDVAVQLRRWARELRTLLLTVTPPSLREQGLAAAVADLAATVEHRGLELRCEAVDVPGATVEQEALLYRVAQESLRNVVRHARARTVSLRLTAERDDVVLEVEDDGEGFDVEVLRAEARRGGSVGLELLSGLVAEQGGSLALRSAPGSGTTVVVRLPLARVPRQRGAARDRASADRS